MYIFLHTIHQNIYVSIFPTSSSGRFYKQLSIYNTHRSLNRLRFLSTKYGDVTKYVDVTKFVQVYA